MNGLVVRKSQEVGVPTPVSAAIVAAMRDVDAGVLRPDSSNIERVLVAAS